MRTRTTTLFVRGRRGKRTPTLFFLEIAVETGVIGVVGFLLFYFTVLRYWWQGRHSMITGAWTAALLAGTFPFNAHLAFYGSYWSGYLWLLIGCTLAATPIPGRDNRARPRLIRIIRGLRS